MPDSSPPARSSSAPEIRADQWAIDIVLDRLQGWRSCGDGFAARCPAHADSSPSLSVRETGTGQILLHCHAGCKIENIAEALGLKFTHLFTSEYARRLGRRRSGKPAPHASMSRLAGSADIDHKSILEIIGHSRVADDNQFLPLCEATGLTVRTCLDFGLGFDGRAFTFPEREDQLRPVGVLYRDLEGRKWCHSGSTRGLTVPVAAPEFDGKLFVTEGATDAMALHSVRLRAIGRPAAVPSGQVFEWLVAYLTKCAREGVAIVGDNDPRGAHGRRVGRDAAMELAQRLAEILPGTIPIAWALPQKPYKDVRQQIKSGAWAEGLRIQEVRR